MIEFMPAHVLFLVGIHKFTGKQRDFFGFEIQIFDQIVVNALDLFGPLFVVGVRLSLVQQIFLDHTFFWANFPMSTKCW